LFSWCLLSWWQQWWLQIEVLWWWWWSLQWLIGKSVSSCFGHHFLKTFVLLLWSSIWFKKHLWDCKGEILLCFITYVSWKKYLWIHGWEISFCFVYLRELKKNHLWTHKCAISFFLLFLCESKKPSVQYQLFSSPMWMKKPTCGPVIMQPFFYIMCVKKTSCGSTSVEYSFLSSFIGVRKSLASSQGSNILSCLFILLWLWPSCCSQCNFWHWSSCWFFVRVYVQSFVIIFSLNRKMGIFKFLGFFAYWNWNRQLWNQDSKLVQFQIKFQFSKVLGCFAYWDRNWRLWNR
jgi:hypothetical protein